MSPNFAWVAGPSLLEGQAGGMPDILAFLPGLGLAALLCVAGWFQLHRRHRDQVDRLIALHKRQVGVGATRLADALRRSEVLKQEVLQLKKELVQQQRRWDRDMARNARVTGAVAAPRVAQVRIHDERSDDGSGFANTQPWDHDSP